MNKMKTQNERRLTRQRRMVLEELRATKLHPTADAVFRAVRRRLPRVSLGTVYRNLSVLRDDNQILELACEGRRSRYDGDTSNHHHFLCTVCRKVFDVVDLGLCDLEGKLERRYGFKVEDRRINFYGRCCGCRRQKK